jgi:hypothetical protein
MRRRCARASAEEYEKLPENATAVDRPKPPWSAAAAVVSAASCRERARAQSVVSTKALSQAVPDKYRRTTSSRRP